MFEEATVIAKTDVTPDCKQLVLQLTDGTFEGRPGQHTVIRRPNGDARPYSVLTLDGNRAAFMIRGYDVDGVADYITEREVGETLEVNPSLRGNLTLNDTDRPIVLIGTGTGITPLVGILHEYVKRDGDHVVLAFGEKTQDQIMYKALFEQFELLYDFEARFSLSRETWSGHEGYVQEQLEAIVDEVGQQADYYVCGVPKAVVAAKEELALLSVPNERVHAEGWEESQVEREE